MPMEYILNHNHHKGKLTEKDLYEIYKIFFGTMVSKSRIKIINLLRKGEKNVSEITNVLKMEQASVSHDLAKLRRCGFVFSERRGAFMNYTLNKKTIGPLMNMIDKHMAEYCIHIWESVKKGEHNG